MNVDRPPRAVGRALGPREHDEDLGVDVRAEVLLAEEPPLVAVRDRACRVRTDVAAALAFGEEHARLPTPRRGRGSVSRRTNSSRTASGAYRSTMSAAPAVMPSPQ